MSPRFAKSTTPLLSEERESNSFHIPQAASVKSMLGARPPVHASLDFCPGALTVFLSMQRSYKVVTFVPRMSRNARFTTTSFVQNKLYFLKFIGVQIVSSLAV